MSRKRFIESLGATCNGWVWSWSFVNHEKRMIIFGAWDVHEEGIFTKIMSDEWKRNSSGRKNAGYKQSVEHLRLVEIDGYNLHTFPQKYSDLNAGEDGAGPAAIGDFTEEITAKTLMKIGTDWYASDLAANEHEGSKNDDPFNKTTDAVKKFIEGAVKKIWVSQHERNRQARNLCIEEYGTTCAVCDINFKETYGSLGEGFIHVHHLVPIADIGIEYEVDPVRDLRPVCPNCHAMLHRKNPPLAIEDLKDKYEENNARLRH